MGVYFQDDWRVTPSLTLNLGVHWEYIGRPAGRYDRVASIDLATGRQLDGGFAHGAGPSGRRPSKTRAPTMNRRCSTAPIAWF